MAKPQEDKTFAAVFYHSWAWTTCRRKYKKRVGGLCERCLKRGLIVPGVQVHHKTHLTPGNISNPEITLNFENLELLCDDCHKREHKNEVQWRTDASGHVEL